MLNSHILITGMYRSGTTLMHHLLDGHESLRVFPVENCIFRDTLVYKQLPFSKQRSIIPLLNLIEGGKILEAVDYIMTHDKLSLPLKKKVVLRGSTGNQVIGTAYDSELFRREIEIELRQLSTESRNTLIASLSDAYLSAYYTASGQLQGNDKVIYVNKCPEAGLLIDYYIEQIPGVKVIHIIRDPRAVIASFKATLPKMLFHPFFRILPQIKLLKYSLTCANRYKNEPNVMVVRYEDLVTQPESIMRKVAEFIDVPFEKNLVQPTFLGEPWKSNSSNLDANDGESDKIFVNLDKYRKKLNKKEISLIESMCQSELEKQGYILDTPKPNLGERKNKITYIFLSLLSVKTYLFKLKQHLTRN
jgi:hypothetical protein